MTYIKAITGPGITNHVGMVSADLGIARWDAKRGAVAVMFGDNFTDQYLRGEWQSPSIVMYDNDYNVLGIPTVTGIASEGNRRQLWDYPHGNQEYSTILPTDFIKVGALWYVAGMVTAGLGNELRTVFWESRNLVDWSKTDPYVSLNHPGHRGNVMLTFDQVGSYILIFGTGGLNRDEAVFMWRAPASVFPHGVWEPYGYDGARWGWGIPNDNAPILPGKHGELCFRNIQGQCVLSYFDVDEYQQTALCVARPEDDWMAANRVDYAHGQEWPQLYGGYITPDSRLNTPGGMGFLVSQWGTQGNDPYHVILFRDTLTAAGPLIELPTPAPEPEPPAMAVPPTAPPATEDVTTMTPQELFDLLMRELSASGSTKITTPEGNNLTLRQALEQVFWKQRGWYTMTGRPRHPAESDDQLGQILSMRAEVETIYAMVVAMADKMGIDTAALFAQVQRSLK